MVAPMLVVVLVFMGWPAVWTFVLSFTNMTVTGPTATHYQFVGLANYRELFSYGSGLLDSVGKSLYYLIVSGYIGQAALGFLLAYFLSRSAYAVRAVVGAVVIVAWLIPEIVTSYMWYVLLSDGGVMQQGYHLFGLNYQTWLISNPMLAVSLANAWRGARLLVPALLRRARRHPQRPDRRLRGGRRQQLAAPHPPDHPPGVVRHRRRPGHHHARNAERLLADLCHDRGGPGNASNVLSVFMYRQAFSNYQLAYGTAIAVVLLLMGAVLAALYIRLLRRQGSLADMR